MKRVSLISGYTILLLTGFLYILSSNESWVRELSVIATFCGAVLALFSSSTVKVESTSLLLASLEIARLLGLMAICLALLFFGREPLARSGAVAVALLVCTLFVVSAAVKNAQNAKAR